MIASSFGDALLWIKCWKPDHEICSHCQLLKCKNDYVVDLLIHFGNAISLEKDYDLLLFAINLLGSIGTCAHLLCPSNL